MPVAQANYEVVIAESTPEALVIRDLGPWDRFPTVTNAVTQVIYEMRAVGELPPGRRLYYYDSEGNKDEILLDNHGRFNGFATCPLGF